jgi:hypothetical protein
MSQFLNVFILGGGGGVVRYRQMGVGLGFSQRESKRCMEKSSLYFLFSRDWVTRRVICVEVLEKLNQNFLYMHKLFLNVIPVLFKRK